VVEGLTQGGRGAPALSVRLLGGFALDSEAGPIAIDSARLRSLVAHLVLHRGEDQPRERLAYLFWPDSTEGQARTNLRQALHRLRRALPEPDRFLRMESGAVAWRADAPFSLDVAEFEELAGSEDSESIEAAVAKYAGDLLPECYDDWVVPERERLREKFLAVSERFVETIELDRDYRGAIPLAKEILDSDPLNEESCRRLMRLHALSGDRASALRVYHGLATSLARETGVEPSPPTRDAYERLIEPEADGAGPAFRETSDAASPLVGRGSEWEAMRDAWRRASTGEARLVVIKGEAGIGKTRLAEELRDWVTLQGFAVAVSRCYAAAAGLAYAPIVEFLRSDAVGASLREQGDPWLVELARLLPELLEERPDLPLPLPLTDDWQRALLLDTVSRAVLGLGGPLLLVIDDLQWCDDETLDWLRYLLSSQPQAPVLVVTTARTEELDPDHAARVLLLAARERDQAVELDLGPLDRHETGALARSVAGAIWGRTGRPPSFGRRRATPCSSSSGLAPALPMIPRTCRRRSSP
jgi:DNA-binding SARP family transcriptional activator